MQNLKFLACGDCALTVQFSDEISEDVNSRIRYLSGELEKSRIKGFRECVPTFCSVTVYFDADKTSYEKLEKIISKIMADFKEEGIAKRKIFLIPVCYEGEFAPDLDFVCEYSSLTKDEVINIHSGTDYLIYMLGFLPGFPYLGGMDERIAVPRLDSPRTVIPVGSVGIGGKQTGIYPLASPGGWRLIGRTPLKPYDPNRKEPIFYKAGDCIRFYPITADEYETISSAVQKGEYEPKIRWEEK